MKKTKLVSFTLKNETIFKLEAYSKLNSINKSALVDRLINEEMIRKEKTNA